jgi:hypothetical protein
MSSAKRDLGSFRAAHDKSVIVPNKIKAALAALEKRDGVEAWCYDAELLKLADLSVNDIAPYREKFENHIVITPAARGRQGKRVWFANTKTAAKARGTK